MTVSSPAVEHHAEVVPHRRWRGWWRWTCTCGDWCRTNNEDVARRTAAGHEEIEAAR